MNKFKKAIAAIIAGISVVTLAAGLAACGNGGPAKVEKERISECKLEYNWGEVFTGENLAYEITFPDGTKDYATEGFTFTRASGEITEPLTGSDKTISVTWNGEKDEKEYTFSDTLTLTMVDPHTADAMIFVTTTNVPAGDNDKVYMLGDGTFYACGIQAVEWWQYIAAQGHWSWDGSELCVVVEKDSGADIEGGGRTITVNKDAEGNYTFKVYWGAFPMSIMITKAQADIYLTADTRFGDTTLTKDKNYPVWNDDTDIKGSTYE